jgi:myosin heavy subunit
MDYMRRARWEFRQWLPRAAVGVSIVALVVTAGILVEKLTDTRNELNEFKVHAARTENEAAQLNSRLQQVAQAKDTTGGQLLRVEAELSAAREHADESNTALQTDRETVQRLQQQVTSLNANNAAAAEHSSAQETTLAASQEQLQKVQAHASAIEADLVTQQYQIKDLTAQLDTQKLDTERERELMAAGHEIRDLMGARDLHMIDVRDVDLKGNWKQPYGRIFLTDNKQLIFYAFDLNKAAGHDKSFQVWGQRFDNESSTVSLGTFRLDDQKQSRWIMKVSNPQLLSSIDSVFVTVENSAGGKRPTGKPLMNAYLRNPINHP